MRSGSRFCLLLLLALGFSSPASALTFDLDVQVVGRADVGGEDTITFQASFVPAGAPAEPIVGYDITIAWDPNELTFGGFTDFFGGFGADPDPAMPGGTFVRRLDLNPKAAGILFEVDFVVEPSATLDGVLDDFRVFIGVANDVGIGSPVGFTHDVSNPEGFGFDVGASSVPEPATLALIASAAAGLGLRRRR